RPESRGATHDTTHRPAPRARVGRRYVHRMTVVHPIARAWISTGGTGARNYDEFADDAEITEIVAANPDSALAIEMPHRAPANVGQSFTASLPDAVARLTRQKADGSYVPAENVVILYRISES